MKGLQIAVILLVFSISALEALECWTCTAKASDCDGVKDECEDPADLCAKVKIDDTVSKECMTAAEIANVAEAENADVYSCNTDLCNA